MGYCGTRKLLLSYQKYIHTMYLVNVIKKFIDYYRGADGVAIVFDLTDELSLKCKYYIIIITGFKK